MRKFILNIAILAAAGVSCSELTPQFNGTVLTDVSLEECTKVTLTGTGSPLKKNRIWKWEEGDVLTYTYVLDGEEHDMATKNAEVDGKSPSLIHVKLTGVPEEAMFTKVVYGSPSVFGKTCIAEDEIPSSIVYASSMISSEPGETNIPGVTLDHKCSYFRISPDYVTSGKTSYQIKDIEITGHSLKGEDSDDKLSITLYDSSSRTFRPVWLALSCNATDIVFTADYGAGKAVMATVASAGGRCTLFDISNLSIGEYYK